MRNIMKIGFVCSWPRSKHTNKINSKELLVLISLILMWKTEEVAEEGKNSPGELPTRINIIILYMLRALIPRLPFAQVKQNSTLSFPNILSQLRNQYRELWKLNNFYPAFSSHPFFCYKTAKLRKNPRQGKFSFVINTINATQRGKESEFKNEKTFL